ncbi:hypothetical protein ACFL56_02775 [Candidatus Margulisiibacteriota bacterium]
MKKLCLMLVLLVAFCFAAVDASAVTGYLVNDNTLLIPSTEQGEQLPDQWDNNKIEVNAIEINTTTYRVGGDSII